MTPKHYTHMKSPETILTNDGAVLHFESGCRFGVHVSDRLYCEGWSAGDDVTITLLSASDHRAEHGSVSVRGAYLSQDGLMFRK